MPTGIYQNLTGKRYGRLLVIKRAPNPANKKRVVRWLCLCDCGVEKSILADSLRFGRAKSCGCYRKTFNNRPFGESAANVKYLRYKQDAKARNLEFNLTKEQFIEITDKNCSYCNALPAQVCETSGGYFIYNGIDRIDSSFGYSLDNCAPCCYTCNEMKMDKSKEDFIEACARVALHA